MKPILSVCHKETVCTVRNVPVIWQNCNYTNRILPKTLFLLIAYTPCNFVNILLAFIEQLKFFNCLLFIIHIYKSYLSKRYDKNKSTKTTFISFLGDKLNGNH